MVGVAHFRPYVYDRDIKVHRLSARLSAILFLKGWRSLSQNKALEKYAICLLDYAQTNISLYV